MIVGLLMWASVDFTFYGIGNLYGLTATIVDIVLEGVHGAIGGTAIAIAQKRAG